MPRDFLRSHDENQLRIFVGMQLEVAFMLNKGDPEAKVRLGHVFGEGPVAFLLVQSTFHILESCPNGIRGS